MTDAKEAVRRYGISNAARGCRECGALNDNWGAVVDTTDGHLVLATAYDALEKENAELRAALQRYGVHDAECVAIPDGSGCSCGFRTSADKERT